MATRKTATKRAANTRKAAEKSVNGAPDAAEAWTEAARDQYETALRAFTDNAEKFRTQTEDAFASARDGFDAAGERMRAVSADTMAAMREEMSDAARFATELARAKSVGDALEIQRDYWTKLFETRVERVRAFTETSTEVARDTFEPMSRSFAAAFSFSPAFDKLFPFASKPE